MNREDREFLIALLQSELEMYDSRHGIDYEKEIKREEEILSTLQVRSQKTIEYKERIVGLIKSLNAE